MFKLAQNQNKGFALIMTMSILMVLSIALIQIFEDRSLEVAQLENSTQQFKTESLARSVFKVLIATINDKGFYWVVTANRRYKEFGVSIDVIGQGTLADLSIQPIDSRFDLNQRFKNDESGREIIFKNILIQCQLENDTQETESYFELNDRDVYKVVSAINDWRDDDTEPYDEYGEGVEYYGAMENPFEIKNSSFDYVSEIKLIPNFNQLKISDYILKKYFRVSNLRTPDEFININLISKGEGDEVVNFLKRYDSVSKYEIVAANAKHISEFLIQNAASQPLDSGGIPKQAYTDVNDFFKDMETEGLLFSEAEKKLFKTKSKYVAVKYAILVDQYQLRVNSLIELTGKKGGIKIHTFSMN